MKNSIIILLFTLLGYAGISQEKVKDTPEKIVTKDAEHNVKTKEKSNEFYAVSDSVKIKDRHGRKKTKDFTAHTVIKEKKNKIKFKNKLEKSWMKIRNGKVTKSKNYKESGVSTNLALPK